MSACCLLAAWPTRGHAPTLLSTDGRAGGARCRSPPPSSPTVCYVLAEWSLTLPSRSADAAPCRFRPNRSPLPSLPTALPRCQQLAECWPCGQTVHGRRPCWWRSLPLTAAVVSDRFRRAVSLSWDGWTVPKERAERRGRDMPTHTQAAREAVPWLVRELYAQPYAIRLPYT